MGISACLYELADVIAHIYNSSLSTGVVPSQWLTAVITPVPKIPNPGTLSDFRPIFRLRLFYLVFLRS